MVLIDDAEVVRNEILVIDGRVLALPTLSAAIR